MHRTAFTLKLSPLSTHLPKNKKHCSFYPCLSNYGKQSDGNHYSKSDVNH